MTDLSHASAARLLAAADIDAVIAIDRAHSGHVRRRFLATRLAAAEDRPADFVGVGVERGGALCAFAVVRLLPGMADPAQRVGVLEAIGVAERPDAHRASACLVEALSRMMRARGVRVLHSQVDWEDEDLLHFLEGTDCELVPRLALERRLAERLREPCKAS